MKKNNLYTLAHLVVAAIRIHEHNHSGPPTIENICDTLLISLEEGNRLSLKLSEMLIIEALEKPGGTRLFIKNHLLIEDIPNQPETNNLQSELDQFKESRKEPAKQASYTTTNLPGITFCKSFSQRARSEASSTWVSTPYWTWNVVLSP